MPWRVLERPQEVILRKKDDHLLNEPM
jgi:hypothetical protein